MSWNLNLSFNGNQLQASFTPPNVNYYEKEIKVITDLNSPYLDGADLHGYQDGDYIRVILVDENSSNNNSGTIVTLLDLYDTAEDYFAFVVIYDDKEGEVGDERKSNKKIRHFI